VLHYVVIDKAGNQLYFLDSLAIDVLSNSFGAIPDPELQAQPCTKN
jgi:hypothetical protein